MHSRGCCEHLLVFPFGLKHHISFPHRFAINTDAILYCCIQHFWRRFHRNQFEISHCFTLTPVDEIASRNLACMSLAPLRSAYGITPLGGRVGSSTTSAARDACHAHHAA